MLWDNDGRLAKPLMARLAQRVGDRNLLVLIGRMLKAKVVMTDGVVETPHGAHFTECVPDYPRDEKFQREYVATAKSEEAWFDFRAKYIDVTEADYQQAVREWRVKA